MRKKSFKPHPERTKRSWSAVSPNHQCYQAPDIFYHRTLKEKVNDAFILGAKTTFHIPLFIFTKLFLVSMAFSLTNHMNNLIFKGILAFQSLLFGL